ncbi:hypothetical protein EC01288_1042 [Escherichia coli 0.1288]|nr:hypothetical protein EC01288_1042 [Escherichia coli 0.1288]
MAASKTSIPVIIFFGILYPYTDDIIYSTYTKNDHKNTMKTA